MRMKTGPSQHRPSAQKIVQAILDFYHNLHALPPGDPAEEAAKYQSTFDPDAAEKARQVIKFIKDCHPKPRPAQIIYCSLGGGTGAEIQQAMRLARFQRGLLLEYMPDAAKVGEQHALDLKAAGRGELKVIPGDAAQVLETVQRHLRIWRNTPGAKLDGLLISAQAVIHELPDRADPRKYHFQKFCALYDDFPIKLYHSREPSRPSPDSGWTEDVQFKVPGLTGEELANACTLMQRHHGHRFQGPDGAAFHRPIFKVGLDYVQAPGLVAVEFLHKFLRYKHPWNFRHEMEECLVSLNPQFIRNQLATVFGGVQHVSVEPTVSGGFRDEYLRFGVQARRADRVAEQLPVPLCFTIFKAFSCVEPQAPVLPVPAPAGAQPSPAAAKAAKPPAPRRVTIPAQASVGVPPRATRRASARVAKPRAESTLKTPQRTGGQAPAPVGQSLRDAQQAKNVAGDAIFSSPARRRSSSARAPKKVVVKQKISVTDHATATITGVSLSR